MKNFKNILATAALFTIGSTHTKQMGTPSRAVAPATTPKPTYATAPATAPKPTIAAKAGNVPTTCISASVLPVYTKNNKKYVILTREARGSDYTQGGKRFTYDDFSGQCEKEDNYNPLLSAAREFHEEGNLKRSLGLNLEETIKLVQDNTTQVIAYEKGVDNSIPGSRAINNFTYIINFDKYADKLFDNFYTALNQEKAHFKKLGKNPERQVTTEKDMIAAVLWDDLQGAISYQPIISGAVPVKVQALVRDEKTKKFHKQEIILRPFLAIKLRSLFLNQTYETSRENNKVQYYHQ